MNGKLVALLIVLLVIEVALLALALYWAFGGRI